MKDRDAYWSHSTLIMAMIIAFAMGFAVCQNIYAGFNTKGRLHELR
jgi:hypothetical protein